jgi:hypothetical protein
MMRDCRSREPRRSFTSLRLSLPSGFPGVTRSVFTSARTEPCRTIPHRGPAQIERRGNIGAGFLSFALKQWEDSAGHLENLLMAGARRAGITSVDNPKSVMTN